MSKVIEQWRWRLPHWEVDSGCYFITIRCAGSLPLAVNEQIREIARELKNVSAASGDFAVLQRKYFLTVEKYLDRGFGFCPFENENVAECFVEQFRELENRGWFVEHYVLMPNHVHLIVRVDDDSMESLKSIWPWFKGRSARELNWVLKRTGAFWQADSFDRWIRHEEEYARTVKYILNNPVKAGLVSKADEYRWLK